MQKETEEWSMGPLKIYWEIEDNKNFAQLILPDSTYSEETSGYFEVNQNGTYTFLAHDSCGNVTKKEIQVQKLDNINPTLTLEQTIEKRITQITWKIEDLQSGIRGILLPNGNMTTEKQGSYRIEEKGNYVFIVYDHAGNETKKEIVIEELAVDSSKALKDVSRIITHKK